MQENPSDIQDNQQLQTPETATEPAESAFEALLRRAKEAPSPLARSRFLREAERASDEERANARPFPYDKLADFYRHLRHYLGYLEMRDLEPIPYKVLGFDSGPLRQFDAFMWEWANSNHGPKPPPLPARIPDVDAARQATKKMLEWHQQAGQNRPACESSSPAHAPRTHVGEEGPGNLGQPTSTAAQTPEDTAAYDGAGQPGQPLTAHERSDATQGVRQASPATARSDDTEILQRYRRGPDAKKSKVAKRNELIDQAKRAAIVDENEIFEFVRREDPSLLVATKQGQRLISVQAMMKAYNLARAAPGKPGELQ
jgi:hypothetical protein